MNFTIFFFIFIPLSSYGGDLHTKKMRFFNSVYSNFPDYKKRNAEEGRKREPRKWVEVLVKSLILDENGYKKKFFCLSFLP